MTYMKAADRIWSIALDRAGKGEEVLVIPRGIPVSLVYFAWIYPNAAHQRPVNVFVLLYFSNDIAR